MPISMIEDQGMEHFSLLVLQNNAISLPTSINIGCC